MLKMIGGGVGPTVLNARNGELLSVNGRIIDTISMVPPWPVRLSSPANFVSAMEIPAIRDP
jgi:hypothetical protein